MPAPTSPRPNQSPGRLVLLAALAAATLLRPGLAEGSDQPRPKPVLIRDVAVWDGESDHALLHQDVLVRGRLIEAVGTNLVLEDGAVLIDGGGRTLIPGLSDAHRHLMLNLPPADLLNASRAYPAARAVRAAQDILLMGFTTVRDMGGPVMGIKQAIDEGIVPGPRIYASGAMLSQTSGHGDLRPRSELDHHLTGGSADIFQLTGWYFVVNGRTEVLRAVRENLRQGVAQIKMMAGGGITSPNDPLNTVQFTADELRAGVQAATDWGTYVAVHAYTPESILRSLAAGVKSIEHGQLADAEAMRAIKEHGAFLVPQAYWVYRDPYSAQHPDKFLEVQRGTEHEMDLAQQYGVTVAFGTDVFGSLGIEAAALKEFTARTRWYAPVDILRQATSINARLFALSGALNPYPEGALGVIRPGAYADLLIYDGNPLEDITVLTRPEETLKLVMKDGVVYKNELPSSKERSASATP